MAQAVLPSAPPAPWVGLQGFLQELGLAVYLKSMVDQGYEDLATLTALDDAEFKEMAEVCGIVPGHRKKIRIHLTAKRQPQYDAPPPAYEHVDNSPRLHHVAAEKQQAQKDQELAELQRQLQEANARAAEATAKAAEEQARVALMQREAQDKADRFLNIRNRNKKTLDRMLAIWTANDCRAMIQAIPSLYRHDYTCTSTVGDAPKTFGSISALPGAFEYIFNTCKGQYYNCEVLPDQDGDPFILRGRNKIRYPGSDWNCQFVIRFDESGMYRHGDYYAQRCG